jgi:hypothetical protein
VLKETFPITAPPKIDAILIAMDAMSVAIPIVKSE